MQTAEGSRRTRNGFADWGSNGRLECFAPGGKLTADDEKDSFLCKLHDVRSQDPFLRWIQGGTDHSVSEM